MQDKRTQQPRRTPGIVVRHHRRCPSRDGGNCGKPCTPAFEAWLFDRRTGRKIRKTFPTLSAAKAWRTHSASALGKGEIRAAKSVTLAAAAERLLDGARTGSIRRRGGQPFRPSTIRSYDASLRLHVLPELGHRRLGDITHADLRALVRKLSGEGRDPSTIRNAINPVRVIFREAIADGSVSVDPTARLALPTVDGRRERVAPPDEAEELIAALPKGDRALFATAAYAGLRRGELMGFEWENIDFDANVIRVEHGWDEREGRIGPKSRAGRREVPLTMRLAAYLHEHQRTTSRKTGLVFGRTATSAFMPSSVSRRATKAWAKANEARAEKKKPPLRPIGLHELRHTFASYMIAAGAGPKELSEYMGHASIAVTMDVYGKLFPGRAAESAAMLDAYLARSDTAARVAQVDR